MEIQGSLRLVGKHIVVTGAGRGIGRATAIRMARAGAAGIVLAARTEWQLEETAEEVRAAGAVPVIVPTDVGQPEEVERLIRRARDAFSSIDVFVNNAGEGAAGTGKELDQITDDEWENGIAVNLSSCFYAARALHRVFVEQRYGKFIVVSSMYGLRGGRNNFMYCVAKGGLLQLMRSLALTWNRIGVRVNAICPGFVATDMIFPRGRSGDANPNQGRLTSIPVGGVASPEEIARWIHFLASSASDAMTGQVLTIDGGSSAAGYAPPDLTFA